MLAEHIEKFELIEDEQALRLLLDDDDGETWPPVFYKPEHIVGSDLAALPDDFSAIAQAESSVANPTHVAESVAEAVMASPPVNENLNQALTSTNTLISALAPTMSEVLQGMAQGQIPVVHEALTTSVEIQQMAVTLSAVQAIHNYQEMTGAEAMLDPVQAQTVSQAIKTLASATPGQPAVIEAMTSVMETISQALASPQVQQQAALTEAYTANSQQQVIANLNQTLSPIEASVPAVGEVREVATKAVTQAVTTGQLSEVHPTVEAAYTQAIKQTESAPLPAEAKAQITTTLSQARADVSESRPVQFIETLGKSTESAPAAQPENITAHTVEKQSGEKPAPNVVAFYPQAGVQSPMPASPPDIKAPLVVDVVKTVDPPEKPAKPFEIPATGQDFKREAPAFESKPEPKFQPAEPQSPVKPAEQPKPVTPVVEVPKVLMPEPKPQKPYTVPEKAPDVQVTDPMAEVMAHPPGCSCPKCKGTDQTPDYQKPDTQTAIADPMAEITSHPPGCSCPKCTGETELKPPSAPPPSKPMTPPSMEPPKMPPPQMQRG